MYATFVILFCLLITSCSPRYSDFFPYHDNGTKKPSLTLLPVYNETHSPMAHDFTDLFTKAVRNRLKRSGKVYSPPIAQMQNALRNVTLKELADSSDLKAFKNFSGTDFVVLMDLVECQVAPYKRGQFKPIYLADVDPEDAKVLSIGMRLKIVNIKGQDPKSSRIELLKSNHMMSSEQLKKAERGDIEALEMIRSRLARDVAQKIEETVCVKK